MNLDSNKGVIKTPDLTTDRNRMRTYSALLARSTTPAFRILFVVQRTVPGLHIIRSRATINDIPIASLPRLAHDRWIGNFQIHEPCGRDAVLEPSAHGRLLYPEDPRSCGGSPEFSDNRSRKLGRGLGGFGSLSHAQV